jgi:serine/threonine protein kinase
MDHTIQYPLGINRQDVVGLGITALVARLDAVIKFARRTELPLLEREKGIYERLGHDHDGILRYYGNLGDALILQYACYGSIRQYYASQAKSLSLSLQLRWVEQITASVAFIHSRNVLHGDISCNNVLLDEGLNAKLGDFAGSSMDGQDPLICYETSHEHPEIIGISAESELFALGSTFYEIMTGSKPYKELSDTEIIRAYKEGNYPSLVSLAAFNNTIHKCWTQGYASVDELLEDVKAEGMNFQLLRCSTLIVPSCYQIQTCHTIPTICTPSYHRIPNSPYSHFPASYPVLGKKPSLSSLCLVFLVNI